LGLQEMTGAIARDSRGKFIAAATWYIPQVNTVDSAKTTAIRNGLYLAGKIGCNKVLIESDNSFVVESVQNPDAHAGLDAVMVAECKHLALDFASVDYSHCFREANEVAHTLAQKSFSDKSSIFWESSIPDFISHSIVNDLAII
jgi:hypothetical protein